MSEIDQIIKAAIELQQEGKTPNTALLKVRTQNQFSLPTLISGLKTFKSMNPEQYSKWSTTENYAPQKIETSTMTAEQKVEQLEKQVADLIKQQQMLEQRILKLETGE